MNAADRNEMIEQLRALIAGRGDGIDLDTPIHWAIAGLRRPEPFFQHLPSLLPPDSILYVERIADETVARFSEALGVSYGREQTGWRDPELLRKVLWSLEDPEQRVLALEGGTLFRRKP